MKRITSLILIAVLLVTALISTIFTLSANATDVHGGGQQHVENPLLRRLKNASAPKADGPWLPDPCNVFGVSGTYWMSQVFSGTQVHFYIYELNMDMERMSDAVNLYAQALEDLGYEKYYIEDESFIDALAFTKSYETAELYLQIIDDSYYVNEYSDLTWQVILAVPDTIQFQLGKETPGVVDASHRCPSCEGSRVCKFCNGSGMFNYGSGYETCAGCDGCRYCTVCGGDGSIY